MSRILTIAQWDLRRVLRARLLWGAMLLLGVMFLPSTASIASSGHRDIGELLVLLPTDLITFALVVVAAVGYNAIIGERTTGTVRTVLGLSGTRPALVVGSFLARGTVVALVLAVVLAITNVLIFRGYGDLYLIPFWVMAGWMIVYGVVWTAVTVGYSAAFNSQSRTLGALLMTYATFSPSVGVWGVLVEPLFALVFTGSTAIPAYDGLAPLWIRVTGRLNPVTGFVAVLRWSVRTVGPGTPGSGITLQLFGTAVFLCFGVLGLFIGVRRFDRADLCHDEERSWWRTRLARRLRTVATVVPTGRHRSESTHTRSRTLTIAGADLRHGLQHWVIVGAVALFALLVGPQLWTGVDPSGISTVSEELTGITDTFTLPILVLTIATGYGAVVGERESGTVRLMLGSAASRRDIMLGKIGARLVLVVVALMPAIIFAEGLIATRFGAMFPVAFLAWAGWIVWNGLIWTAVVVGFSAAVSSRYRTLAALFATYLLFGPGVGLWDPVIRPLFSVLFTGQVSTYERYVHAADAPLWFTYTNHLNPLIALQTIRDGLFILAGHGTEFMTASPLLVVFSIGISVLFATGPLLVGYRRFERTDLS